MSDTEPTDAQIRGAIRWHWKREFNNWGGDSLNEAVMDLTSEDADEDIERSVYERACALLSTATIQIVWSDGAEVEILTEWGDEEDA